MDHGSNATSNEDSTVDMPSFAYPTENRSSIHVTADNYKLQSVLSDNNVPLLHPDAKFIESAYASMHQKVNISNSDKQNASVSADISAVQKHNLQGVTHHESDNCIQTESVHSHSQPNVGLNVLLGTFKKQDSIDTSNCSSDSFESAREILNIDEAEIVSETNFKTEICIIGCESCLIVPEIRIISEHESCKKESKATLKVAPNNVYSRSNNYEFQSNVESIVDLSTQRDSRYTESEKADAARMNICAVEYRENPEILVTKTITERLDPAMNKRKQQEENSTRIESGVVELHPPEVPPRPKHLSKRFGMLSYLNLPMSQRVAPALTLERIAQARRNSSLKRTVSQPIELNTSLEEPVKLYVNMNICKQQVQGTSTGVPVQPQVLSNQSTQVFNNYTEESNRTQAKHSNKKSTATIEEKQTTLTTVDELNGSRDKKSSQTPPSSPQSPRRAFIQRRTEEHKGNKGRPAGIRRRLATALNVTATMRKLTNSSSAPRRSNDSSNEDVARKVDAVGELTPLGWQWHRLHLSTARLQVSSATAELFAGFVMLALVEMQINLPSTVPELAWTLFAANTTALVGLNILALTATTCVLPDVTVVPRLAASTSPQLLRESPHERLRKLIHLVWATANFLGLALYFVEITLIAWVKFWDLAFMGATISTCIGVPTLILFVIVAVYLWHTIKRHESHQHSSCTFTNETYTGGDELEDEYISPHVSRMPSSARASQLQLDMLSVASHGSEDEDAMGHDKQHEDDPWRRLHVSLGKLEATNCMSELLAGFGTSATVELQTNSPTLVTTWLFTLLAVNTMVLVVVNLFTLMLATFLLPSTRALQQSRAVSVLSRGPHHRLRRLLAAAWSFTTVVSVLLFLIEIAILCWVKFVDFSIVASIVSSSIVLGAALIYLVVLVVHFWRGKCRRRTQEKIELQDQIRTAYTMRY